MERRNELRAFFRKAAVANVSKLFSLCFRSVWRNICTIEIEALEWPPQRKCVSTGLDIYKHVLKCLSCIQYIQCVDLHVSHHVFLLAAIPEDLQSRTLGLTNDGGEQCVMPGSGGRFITGIWARRPSSPVRRNDRERWSPARCYSAH